MSLPASPELMSAVDTALLLIDFQERLMPAIHDGARVAWNGARLLEGAAILGVAAFATEQYPKGLGPTIPAIGKYFEGQKIPEKVVFSAGACGELFDKMRANNLKKILVGGVETHVCVQQTVMDLLADGWGVFVAVDAVGSRRTQDHETALRRMETAGATLTTTEAALFEWLRAAGTPEFKKISQLVRQLDP